MMNTVAVMGVVLSLFSGVGAHPQPPYGIDFKGGPTGRFSNGKTNVDVIAELLGFDDYIPPYATVRGQYMLKGVNYASAAVGIREETGQHLGVRISSMGSRLFSPVEYADVLIESYAQKLRCLYSYEARKMVLFGIGFKDTNAGCCGVGRNHGQITSLPMQIPCENRREYLFWDAYHPTEAGNAIIGSRADSAQPASDAYPIDTRRLAQI
ncbi:hypothetical protein K1719_007794 [Acacia pycnantha]|nr:hypothetical protein K1719_007794 [Acacia pycnantha]